MRAEIICVGTELLLGDIVNTNASFVARQLSRLGISVYNQQVVGDNPARLKEAAILARSRSDIVIYTGGLGPTDDDLTKQTVAEVYSDTLVENRDVLADISAYFEQSGRIMTDNNRKQALVPQKGRFLKNSHGTAPGIIFLDGEKMAVLMPGVPKEMEPMMTNQVVPLLKRLVNGVILSKHVRVIGIGESALEEKIKVLLNGENPTVALYCKTGEVDVRITARAKDGVTASAMLDEQYKKLDSLIHDYIYGVDVDNIETAIVNTLKKRGQTVATAESCTGGNLSARITSVSGASSVFGMGVCTYSEEQKHKILGVDLEDLETFTAVSSPVAIQMAQGALKKSGADYAIATTGYAGPTGGTPEEPVGTVYIAVATHENVHVKKCYFTGDRQRIVALACQTAFDMLRHVMDGKTYTGARIVDNTDDTEEEENEPKKKGGFFKAFFTMIFLVVLSALLAFGYIKLKSDGGLENLKLPKISLSVMAGNIANMFSKDVDIQTTMEERLNTDFFSQGFERKTMKLVNRLCVQNQNIKGWLTFKSARLEYPVASSKENTEFAGQVYYLSDPTIPDYRFIGGFSKGNSFDFTDLTTIKSNSSFVLFDENGYTDYRIFSVGTFSAEDLGRFAEISDKQEFIVWARARSIFDVDIMVTDKTDVLVFLQEMEEGEYVAVFSVPCDRNVFPSVDIKTMTVYADWYMEKMGLSDEMAGEAMSYAQEIYDRDSWTITNLGLEAANPQHRDNINSQVQNSEASSQSSNSSQQMNVSSQNTNSKPASSSADKNSEANSASSKPERTPTPTPTPTATPTPPATQPTPEVPGEEILSVTMNGVPTQAPASQILAQIVSIEMSPSWNAEALKAQAVAAHSYIEYQYSLGLQAPAVSGRTVPDRRVVAAVKDVADVIITSGGKPINAVYTASAAGRTNPASQVWGQNYAYLQSVESKYDYLSTGYEKTYKISAQQLKKVLDGYIGTNLDMDDCENWFEILDYTDGGYVRRMRIGDKTTYKNGSRNITGYYFVYDIMYGEFDGATMKSQCFDIAYNDGYFTFTTRGYGHGVGLSQWGALLYAQNEGWTYDKILTHYYTNVTLTRH